MKKLDELAKRLVEIRTERRGIAKQDRALSEEFDDISGEVCSILKEMGVEATRTAYATMTVTRKTVPNVRSWDEFNQFVKDRDALFLFQKRISSAAWQEMRDFLKAEMGDDAEVPGTEAFETTTLSVKAK